jgi:hypothetical protein
MRYTLSQAAASCLLRSKMVPWSLFRANLALLFRLHRLKQLLRREHKVLLVVAARLHLRGLPRRARLLYLVAVLVARRLLLRALLVLVRLVHHQRLCRVEVKARLNCQALGRECNHLDLHQVLGRECSHLDLHHAR